MNPDRIRAAIRTLYPDHMTPTARNVLERILDQENHEAVADAAASSMSKEDELSRIDEIKDRVNSVSAGDWATAGSQIRNQVRAYAPNGFGAYNPVATAETPADAEFIANAPSDITFLLSALEEAKAIKEGE